jgi:hypothetical protein
MALDTNRFLNSLRSAVSWEEARRGVHLLLSDLTDQISNGFKQLAVQPTGKVQPPAPVQNLNVVANSGTVHAVITHNSELRKGAHYFIEASPNDPAFGQPHVFDLGASRSLFTALPGKDSSGTNINYYFRSYVQYPGSDPAPHTNFGTKYVPTPVVVGGSAQFTPLASTGSGTGLANGTTGGVGFGTVLQRPAPGPKRQLTTV